MRFRVVLSLAILALLFISEGVNAQAETVVRKDSNGDPVEEDGDSDGKGGNEKRECVCGHCGPGLLEDHHWCSYHKECLSNLCEGWVTHKCNGKCIPKDLPEWRPARRRRRLIDVIQRRMWL